MVHLYFLPFVTNSLDLLVCSSEDTIDMVVSNAEDYSWVDPQYLGIPSKRVERTGEYRFPLKLGLLRIEKFW